VDKINLPINDLVTVCIATYNRRELLYATIETILSQTYENLQIIIVDDHSSDDTEQFVKESILGRDKRVVYLRHDENRGLAAARNTAIFHAEGKFYTFCDDDDRWEKEFIEKFVKLARHYNAGWCFACGGKYTNALGTIVSMTNDVEYGLREYIQLGYTPPIASQFYFVESLRKAGGYNEALRSGIDHDLWFRLAKLNIKIKTIPIPMSVQNSSIDIDRITTNYHKRISEIKASLEIWRDDLVSMYGVNFYDRYSQAYLEREKLFLFNLYLTEGQIIEALKNMNDLPFTKAFVIMIRVLLKCTIKTCVPSIFIPSGKTCKILPAIQVSNDDRSK
jgi:teichuronic acid biosynthesis glycosyltransferase TuaG